MNEEQDLERRRTAYRQSGLAVARYTQGRTVPDLSLDRPETPVAPERSIYLDDYLMQARPHRGGKRWQYVA